MRLGDTRDLVHPEGAAERFAQRYENRGFRMWTDENGQFRGTVRPRRRGAAWIRAMIDAGLRPRRGGPRFVTDEERAAAQALVEDPRTNDQLAYDLLLATLKAGCSRHPGAGLRRPPARRAHDRREGCRQLGATPSAASSASVASRIAATSSPARSSTARSAQPASSEIVVDRATAIRSISAASSGCSRRSRSSRWR